MTEQMTETNIMPTAEPDTYHDQKALMRLAEIANRIAWLFLFLFLVVGGVIIYLIYLTVKGRIGVEQFFINLPTYLVPFFIGGFIWIALMVVSEAVYLVMDIEDNTRRPKPTTEHESPSLESGKSSIAAETAANSSNSSENRTVAGSSADQSDS